jgi:hypothetical protein
MVSPRALSVVSVATIAWSTLRRWHHRAADAAGDAEFERARATLRHLEEAIATEDEPDVVVIAAAYHLGQLLGLDDVAWAWHPEPGWVARLDDDATIHCGARRWATPSRGLPERTRRALVCGPNHYGWIVMTHRAGHHPVSKQALHAAVELCDRVAACLAVHAHPPISYTA